jgi:hypothetical protein
MKNYALWLLFPLLVGCSSSPSGGGGAPDSGTDSGSEPDGAEVTDSATVTLPDSEWTSIPFPSGADVYSVWAEASDKVWIGADDGLYRSKDGTTFEKVDVGVPVSIRDVNVDLFLAPYARAAGASGANRVVLEYDSASETWTQFAWSPSYTLSEAGAPLGRISSAGVSFWITATDGSIAGTYDPTALFGEPNLYDASMGDIVSYSASVYGIAGPFTTRAYAGTNRGIIRWGGATSGPDNWTKQTEDFSIADFYLDGTTFEIWAVGAGIYKYDGEELATWTSLSGGTWSSIQAVGTELWVAGGGSLARSTDRATFTTIELAPGSQLNDVSGASPNDLWAVGSGGKVWRCVGSACGEPSSLP